MMAELGLDVSGAAVARRYADIIDGFIIDHVDPIPAPLRGVTFFSAATLMSSVDDQLRLARAVLRAADTLVA
jgi:LPPG:FO 2-phospho-L-lactate transferase